jgi:hypothetical protein
MVMRRAIPENAGLQKAKFRGLRRPSSYPEPQKVRAAGSDVNTWNAAFVPGPLKVEIFRKPIKLVIIRDGIYTRKFVVNIARARFQGRGSSHVNI